MQRADLPTEFTLKSDAALRVFRACGWIVLACGAMLGLLAIIVAVAPVWGTATSQDSLLLIILAISAPWSLWAGWAMLIYGVRLSPNRLSSGGVRLRRCAPQDVVSVDIRRHDFGRAPRVVPFVVLRNGTAFPLVSLVSPLGSGGAGVGLGVSTQTHEKVVRQLRLALGVGGSGLPG